MRINEEIDVSEVRLIGVNGEQVGIVTLAGAIVLADEAGVDLVEIAPTAQPPVCRLMDYGKFRYQESKKKHDAKLKQKQVQIIMLNMYSKIATCLTIISNTFGAMEHI